MEKSKIEELIIDANFAKLKYISLLSFSFSVFALFTDYFVQGVWREEYLYLYKLLDIVLALISVAAISFFFLFKIKNRNLKKMGIIIYPFLVLVWASIMTGIDFNFLDYSTLIVVVLVTAFFLYLDLTVSIIYFVSSSILLMATLYSMGKTNVNYLSLIFILIPTISIAIFISWRNYKHKINDILNQEKLVVLNKKLQNSNDNLELEVIKRTEEIQEALKKAEESDRLKSAFLANMSHEIRTPMNGILGFAGLLKEADLTGEEQKDYIEIIEKSGRRMLNIINDIIDISKIEAGLMEVDIRETNIIAQAEYIYTFFQPEVESKGMRLILKKSDPSQEILIYTDREKIYAILINLVKNAIKYSEKGTIEFGFEKKKNYLEFFVKDSGIGIPKNRQLAIFDRFVQADIIDKEALQGAGLGLSISKAYVEILGGKIWVESEEGKGSEFYFTIPYNIEPNKLINDKNNISDEKTMNLDNTLKILIAEDDMTSEKLVKISLRQFSKEILEARTGFETVDLCRNNPDIDLVMMDIRMPSMDGYEATRQIRQFNEDVIIIAQTAYGLVGDREKAIEAGCNDYISKPLDTVALKGLIHKYFNK